MDLIDAWTQAQNRVLALVADLTPEQAGARVPACPDWTVRDLFSHMVGLGVDVLDGDEPDDHNSEWTGRQVTKRRDRDLTALVAEWRSVTGALQEWMRANGARPLGDVIIHEQDLRGALGVSGGQDSGGLHAIRDRFAPRVAEAVDDLPPIALVGDQWQWASRGEPAAAQVVVRAPDFDLARALVSRRSEHQLRGWTRQGDISPYLGAFALLGGLPETDLSE